jgi:hypothetical protein
MTPRFAPALLALGLLLTGCGGGGDKVAATSGTALVGTFGVQAGACTASGPSGSWFRMVTPSGTVADGPFVDNADSRCTDKTVTVLAPGSDGGLRTGGFQPQPTPPFDAKGASLAARVVAPVQFFAVGFGVATNEVDPQAKAKVTAPVVTVEGSVLSADLRSWAVGWNGQHFNQGAPKPDGSGQRATGTYDKATGAYTLEWTSKISGGPFNGFTGVWHLTGTFREA